MYLSLGTYFFNLYCSFAFSHCIFCVIVHIKIGAGHSAWIIQLNSFYDSYVKINGENKLQVQLVYKFSYRSSSVTFLQKIFMKEYCINGSWASMT